MRWKLTLQLAPARDGMKRSPCLLGEDRGELAGVSAHMTSVAFCRKTGERDWFLKFHSKIQTGHVE